MRSRARVLLLALALALALLPACSAADEADRRPGDPVTAPYSDAAVLTLTGEIDFRRSIGRAQAVTSFSDGRPDDTRTMFFTAEQVWFGDVPGLAESLAGAGVPEAAYLRRPVTTAEDSP